MEEIGPTRPEGRSVRKLITVREAAGRLGCSYEAARSLYHAGSLKGYQAPRVGIRVYEDSIDQFVQDHANKRTPAGPRAITPRPRPVRKIAAGPSHGLKYL
jgi:excisionase family DNA binding protein